MRLFIWLGAAEILIEYYILFPVILPGKKEIMNKQTTVTTLGQRIKAQRKRIGMTQEELAEKMCVPKSTISTYETDRVDIKSSVIIELARILETTPNFLLGFGVEDAVTIEIIGALENIKDARTKELLLVQIKALAGIVTQV